MVLWIGLSPWFGRGQTADAFNPRPNKRVQALAIQRDQKLLVGGEFTTIAGTTHSYLCRLSPDGVADSTFNAFFSSSFFAPPAVSAISILPDDRILVAGTFDIVNGHLFQSVCRLNPDGSSDPTFVSNGITGTVWTMLVQPDDKTVIGGSLLGRTLGSAAYLTRLDADGRVDTNFLGKVIQPPFPPRPAGPNSVVYCLAQQSDAKLVIGGNFTQIGTQACSRLARLTIDGALENTFGVGADAAVLCLAVQPDGKILAGGNFTNILGQPHSFLARLNPDGSLDGQFQPAPDGPVESVVLQCDGKIVVGGLFSQIAGQAQNNLARLNGDGTLDDTFANLFATDSGTEVYSLSLEQNGSLVVGGLFTNLNGLSRINLAKLNGSGTTTNELSFDGSTIEFLRQGILPEFGSITFQISTNGTDWIEVGSGVHIPVGWELAGLNFPSNSTVRAQATFFGGVHNASSWNFETSIGQPAITTGPSDQTNLPNTTAAFKVTAVGSSGFSWQWLRNGSPVVDGGNISGATQESLTLSNVFGSDAGFYSVIVSNALGSITSRLATLTVLDPYIASQPASVTTTVGSNVSFSVTATATQPVSYQWRRDGVPIPGASSAALSLTNVQLFDAAHYDVVVSNTFSVILSDAAVLTINQAVLDAFDPGANGTIFATASQNDGKILVGGSFSTLAGQACTNLGRFNSDGTLDRSFNPRPNGPVSALAIQPDGKILTAGTFTMVGDTARSGLGRLNPDGTLDETFTPSIGGITAIVVQPDGNILLGGSFQSVNNWFVSSICRLTTTGALDGTFQNSSTVLGAVHALALQADGRILVGGLFTRILNKSRPRIARLEANGVLDVYFNPGASNSVDCLAIQPDGKILVGGTFTNLAGQPRSRFARLNTDGNLDSTFLVPANAGVTSIALQTDGKITVGGQFTTLGRTARRYLGRVDADGAIDPTFDPGAGSPVNSLGLQIDGKLLIGGSFTNLDGQARGHLGRMNPMEPATQSLIIETNTLSWMRGGSSPELVTTSFDVSTNGTTFEALGSGLRIPGGWEFTMPGPFSNATLRLRGFFSGGQFNGSTWLAETTMGPPVITSGPQNQLDDAGDVAKFNCSAVGSPPLFFQWRRDGLDLPGATTSTLSVTNLQWSDSGSLFQVIVSNAFGSVTSTNASLLVNLAVADSWNPGANTAIRSIAVQPDGKILLGGDFTSVGALPSTRLARVNVDGSVDTAFSGSADNSVYCVGVREDSRIYISGNFSFLGGLPRSYIGRLDTNGVPDSFSPAILGAVGAMALDRDENLLVGSGDYSSAQIVRLTVNDLVDPTFNVTVGQITSPLVTGLLVQPDTSIIAAGWFSSLAGQSCNGFGRLTAQGQLDSSFQLSFGGGQVICMAPQPDGKLVLGGDFNSVNGIERQHIARINSDGSLDPEFNPGADGQVSSLAIQVNGRILVGGWFSTLGGEPRSYIGRLNPDGSLDEAFHPVADRGIFAVALQANGSILLGGYFTRIGNKTRDCAARLLNTDPVSDNLVFDGATLSWLREGGVPELWRVAFDFSEDTTNWTRLGEGSRVSGGWQLQGIGITKPGYFRARGFVPAGCGASAGWFVEKIIQASPTLILTKDPVFGFHDQAFGFDFTGNDGQTVAIDWSTNLLQWQAISTNSIGTIPVKFIAPASTGSPAEFYRLRVLPP